MTTTSSEPFPLTKTYMLRMKVEEHKRQYRCEHRRHGPPCDCPPKPWEMVGGHTVFVVDENGENVARGSIYSPDYMKANRASDDQTRQRPYIYSVSTNPLLQRMGLCKMIFRELERIARDEYGADEVILDATDEGYQAYIRMGWKKVKGNAKVANGWMYSGIPMRKRLKRDGSNSFSSI